MVTLEERLQERVTTYLGQAGVACSEGRLTGPALQNLTREVREGLDLALNASCLDRLGNYVYVADLQSATTLGVNERANASMPASDARTFNQRHDVCHRSLEADKRPKKVEQIIRHS